MSINQSTIGLSTLNTDVVIDSTVSTNQKSLDTFDNGVAKYTATNCPFFTSFYRANI